VAALLALALAACSSDGDDQVSAAADDSVPEAPTATAPETTTTLPPAGRVPTEAEPLQVLLAGDSVMAGLAPAVTAGLESGGAAASTFTLTPALPHQGLDWVGWEARLAELDPEVVVVLIGVWERTQVNLADPAFQAAYDAEVLDPFAQMVVDSGARLVWVGMPGVPDATLSAEFTTLNAALAAQAARWPDGEVTYVDGPAAVSAPDGTQPAIIPRTAGGVTRVRQIDGTHLCADGSTLMARSVLGALQADWAVPLGSGWTTGAWRTGIGLPEQCPSP